MDTFTMTKESPKQICLAPSEGDNYYLFLSLYQAQCLRDELNKTMKLINQANYTDTLVIPFPKREKQND